MTEHPLCGQVAPGNWNAAYLPCCQEPHGHEGDHRAQDYANASVGWPGPRWPRTHAEREGEAISATRCVEVILPPPRLCGERRLGKGEVCELTLGHGGAHIHFGGPFGSGLVVAWGDATPYDGRASE